MIAPTAVLDACVLYSAALRDLFMRVANAGFYAPRWTEQIHDEWMENVLANRPDLSRDKLTRTRELMNFHAEGSLISDYANLIDGLSLPDSDDRHVLAAAIAGKASLIVTYNLSDFPQSALEPFAIEAQHPDLFFCDLFDSDPKKFVDVIRELLAALSNPPKTVSEYLEILRRNRLTRLASRLEVRQNAI